MNGAMPQWAAVSPRNADIYGYNQGTCETLVSSFCAYQVGGAEERWWTREIAMKRAMTLAFAMSLLVAASGAQTASATVAGPVMSKQGATAAQVTSVTKVQWRRYGPGVRYGWHGGWRPGYRWRPGYGWAPLAALGLAAATAGAYTYYGPGPYYYYGPGPYYYGPRW